MRLSFSRPQRPHTIYVLKSYRNTEGRSTTKRVETLGSEEDIERKYGCSDGLAWAQAYVERLNEEERQNKNSVKIELSPTERINPGETVMYEGGDLLLLPLYNELGLPQICDRISKSSKSKFNLNEVLEMLVVLRILYPCSKCGSFELNKKRIRRTSFELEDVYRALTLLSNHIDDIQAQVWENSSKTTGRNTRVIYYDCTNYYFEIEDNDLAEKDPNQPHRHVGIRRRGKSKEHRPNPIVQMGLLMDSDGIPISFIIFPGNESEQPSLKKIEEMVANKFGLNEFIVSTDAGLSSEDNRRYNMTEGREYIAVQSIPSLPEDDQKMALSVDGWHVAFRDPSLPPLFPDDPTRDTFKLDEINLDKERHTSFYKEIIVDKRLGGKAGTERPERVIVTYNHAFALYLKHKRDERVKAAQKMVTNKSANSRQSQQDPRRYLTTCYFTKDGEIAESISMAVDWDKIENEERFDGFYAYGTSLDDDAVDVLKARSFHHEIEHLFRTTKTFLDARPIYVRKEEHIRSHFLVCFLAMVILKTLQKKLGMPEVSIDRLIHTLREFKFDYFKAVGYKPLFERNELTDRLQEINGICVDTQIVTQKRMNKLYRNVKIG